MPISTKMACCLDWKTRHRLSKANGYGILVSNGAQSAGLHRQFSCENPWRKKCIIFVFVNKCIIYDEDSYDRSAHYKSVSEKKGGNQNYGKPYGTPADKWNWKALGGKKTSGGGTPAFVKCCSGKEMGHRASECKSYGQKYFKCGKSDIVLLIVRVIC